MQDNEIRPQQGLSLELQARVRELSEKTSRTCAARDLTQTEVSKIEAEIAHLDLEVDTLVKVNELFRVLVDRLVMDQVNTLTSVVTEGLKPIFSDQDLTFGAELTERRGRVAVDFHLSSGDPDTWGHKGHPLESFGGGITSVISLTLKVLTLLRLKRAPMLFLDESLDAVSEKYVSATGQFLRQLCKSSALDILLVTHNAAFLENADVPYEGDTATSKGLPHLVVRKMK